MVSTGSVTGAGAAFFARFAVFAFGAAFLAVFLAFFTATFLPAFLLTFLVAVLVAFLATFLPTFFAVFLTAVLAVFLATGFTAFFAFFAFFTFFFAAIVGFPLSWSAARAPVESQCTMIRFYVLVLITGTVFEQASHCKPIFF